MKKIYSTFTLIAVILSISFARAQFTGSFVAANWGSVQISCDGYVDLSNMPTSLIMISGDDGSGNSGTIDYTITVPQSGNLSFTWDYSTSDGPQYDYPLYVINGVEYPFLTYDEQGNLTQNGSETCISLVQGDEFAFRMYTDDNSFGPAMVEISSFNFATGIVVTPAASTVCAGTPVTFNASGANNYNWSGGITNGVAFNAPNVTTTFVVTGMVGSCMAMEQVVVTIPPSPNLSLSGIPASVCTGTVLTVTASGATTYNWPGLGATTTTVNIAINGPTVITVQGSLATCTAQLTQTLNVLQSPSLSLNAPNQICAGKQVTLTASGADSYAWNTLAQTAVITPVPANTATYSVIGYSVNGCSANLTHTIIVNANPSVSITPSNTTMCIGQPLQLIAAGASTYVWNTTETTPNLSFTPTVSISSFTVTGTNAAGCTDVKTYMLLTNLCVGLNEVSSSAPSIRVFPNPSTGSIQFESSTTFSSIQITDLSGKVVSRYELSDTITTLNIEHLSNGVYFVKTSFTDSNSFTVTKLVVAK